MDDQDDLWYPQNRFGATVQHLNINQCSSKSEALDTQGAQSENRNLTSTASVNPNIVKNPENSLANMKLEDSSLVISNMYKQECENNNILPTKYEEEFGQIEQAPKNFVIKNEAVSEHMILTEKNWRVDNPRKYTLPRSTSKSLLDGITGPELGSGKDLSDLAQLDLVFRNFAEKILALDFGKVTRLCDEFLVSYSKEITCSKLPAAFVRERGKFTKDNYDEF